MKKTPKKILIHRGQHQPSMHLIADKANNVQSKHNDKGHDVNSIVKSASWLSELSLFSFFGGIFSLLSRLAVFIFRLPNNTKQKIEKNISKKAVNTKKFKSSLSYKFPIHGVTTLVLFIIIIAFTFYGTEQTVAQIKLNIEDGAVNGITSLQKATSSLSAGQKDEANYNFKIAENSFDKITHQISFGPNWLMAWGQYLPFVGTFSAAHEVFAVLEEISSLGSDLSVLPQSDQLANLVATSAVLSQHETDLYIKLHSAIEKLQKVNAKYLPNPYDVFLADLQRNVLPNMSQALQESVDIHTVLSSLFGIEEKQRYYIAFQNNHELRASGGFMGSFALVDVKNGEAVAVEVPSGGTYDVQGQQTAIFEPPAALSLVASKWELQDANWWIDWPTSARQIISLYESAGGSSVDGVVAIDATLLEDMVALVGPIELPQYNLSLTADNVIAETQYQVEVASKNTPNEKPKQIIQDMTEILLTRLSEKAEEDPLQIAELLLVALKDKHIQIYHHEPKVAKALSHLRWDGRLSSLKSDGLAVVHSNIAGQKTDSVINDSVDYNVIVDSDGVATATLTLTRQHSGKKGDLFNGVRSVDYVRVYVPKGSRLIDATGFKKPDGIFFDAPAPNAVTPKSLFSEKSAIEDPGTGVLVYDELGRTVFADWIITDPQQTETVRLVYQLPFRYNFRDNDPSWWSYLTKSEDVARYQFDWTQQPGIKPVSFTYTLSSQSPLKNITSSPEVEALSDGWHWESIMTQDKTIIVDLK